MTNTIKEANFISFDDKDQLVLNVGTRFFTSGRLVDTPILSIPAELDPFGCLAFALKHIFKYTEANEIGCVSACQKRGW